MSRKTCKDCLSEWGGFPTPAVSKRPAPHPGPRCATHHRERKKALKRAAHARWIEKTYGITADQYDQILLAQDGRCFICRRANGSTRRLAVDHDHETGYVRGLLCGPCNKILGHFRDQADAAERTAMYLRNPPAFNVIGKVKPDDGSD